jgi:hypothetical protein
MTDTNAMPIGRVVPPGELRRLVEEEAHRLLLEDGGGDARLLSADDVSALRSRARRNVERRLRSTSTLAETGDIRAEFAANGFECDETSVLAHAKAEVILAAAGREMSEANYLSALHALDSATARRADETELDSHLANAEALADEAANRLYVRGIRKSDEHYEDLFVCEVEAVSRESGVPYAKESDRQ